MYIDIHLHVSTYTYNYMYTHTCIKQQQQLQKSVRFGHDSGLKFHAVPIENKRVCGPSTQV